MDTQLQSWIGWWLAAYLLYGIPITVYAIRTRAFWTPWLAREEGRVLLFRKPPALRRFALLSAGSFLLMLFLILHVMAHPNMTPRRHAMKTSPQTRAVLGTIMIANASFLILLFVYQSGPQETRLDGERRTFESTAGWPWKPKTRTASLDDIQGVSVSPQNLVFLLPRKSAKLTLRPQLSGMETRQAAQALAEKVSRAAWLPIVEYPRKS